METKTEFDKLPERIRHYLLSYKYNNLNRIKEKFGKGGLREFTKLELKKLWGLAKSDDDRVFDGVKEPSMLDSIIEAMEREDARLKVKGSSLAQDFAEKQKAKEDSRNREIDSFHRRFEDRFEEIVEAIIKKYNTKEYKDRWYSRGFMPSESLYWVLLGVASKYGRRASEDSFTDFVSASYDYKGYNFSRLDGQGSVVHIIKIKPSSKSNHHQ